MQATQRRGLAVAAVLWISAGLLFLSLEAITAAAVVPSYSYTHGYISDLGVPAWSPKAMLMNTAFWIQGLGFLAGAVVIARALGGGRVFVGLAAATSVGNILVAVAHGGSALVNAGHAWLHVVGAVLAIVGGNAAIVVGSSVIRRAVAIRGYHIVSVAIAAVGFVCLALLTIKTTKSGLPPGVLERGSVYSILAWQIFTGFLLLGARRA
ncbi:DUF998 domain-containing protein [Mycobacterium sp. MMS18-G62]